MPRFIVKPDRDQDFYVEWSTVVDAPCGWGTRADYAKEYEQARGVEGRAAYAPERFDRADANGSSCMEFEQTPGRDGRPLRLAWFWWDDRDTFLVMNGPGARGTLRRDQLREYCEAMTREGDGSPAAAAMVAPIKDEESEQ